MGLIYLFRRLVFAQVLLGIISFCMAEPNPEILLVAGALVALSWYVAEGPTGKPLPQWVILLGAMAAVGLLVVDLVRMSPQDPNGLVKAVGHLTLWLQVVQLYGRKTNRDYAWLLVLSLLQMVGASVLSISVVFGLLLLVYCILSLFTILMFQIKSTSDLVLETAQRSAPPQVRVRRPSPVVGRGHRGQFRLVGLFVGMGCALLAVLVFVLIPREALYQTVASVEPIRETPRQVGFTKQVQLGHSGPKGGGREPVLHLTVTQNGRNVGAAGTGWLLRGATMDSYDPGRRQWVRSGAIGWSDLPIDLGKSGRELAVGMESAYASGYEATVTLRSTQSRTLFTLSPLLSMELVSAGNVRSILFNPEDQQITLADAYIGSSASGTSGGGSSGGGLGGGGLGGGGGVIYRMRVAARPSGEIREAYRQLVAPAAAPSPVPSTAPAPATAKAGYACGWSVSSKAIAPLAEQIIRQAGLTRHPQAMPSPDDLAIAQALAGYFQSQFTYALNAPAPPPREEPIAYFLLRSRQGHCELFASALTAMCRSVGLKARLVSGYLASDYNRIGGYYAVREKDAHAWVEVDLGSGGWVSIDPTPSNESPTAQAKRDRGWLMWAKQAYEYLEYSWLQNVVAYDGGRRQAMLNSIRRTIGSDSPDPSGESDRWTAMKKKAQAWLDWARQAPWQAGLMSIGLGLLLLAIAGLLRWSVRRRRRLAWLQLTKLPRSKRREMIRQLDFYLAMVQTLDRHGYRRPGWQTPFAFAEQLAKRNPQAFEPVLVLTQFFYQVRFGHQPLSEVQRQQAGDQLKRLSLPAPARIVRPAVRSTASPFSG